MLYITRDEKMDVMTHLFFHTFIAERGKVEIRHQGIVMVFQKEVQLSGIAGSYNKEKSHQRRAGKVSKFPSIAGNFVMMYAAQIMLDSLLISIGQSV